MKEFFTNFWSSQAFFERAIRTAIFGLGSLVSSGIIPTGINGAGGKIGAVIQMAALLVAAGQKNKEGLK